MDWWPELGCAVGGWQLASISTLLLSRACGALDPDSDPDFDFDEWWISLREIQWLRSRAADCSETPGARRKAVLALVGVFDSVARPDSCGGG